MIFNEKEMIKTLNKCLHYEGLTNKEYATILSLITYLTYDGPRITKEEFDALFTCECLPYSSDTFCINITQKKKIYLYKEKNDKVRMYNPETATSIAPYIQESVQLLAYEFLMKELNKIEEK